MLKFEDEFFMDEKRCDFMVCEKMKRAWAMELDLLSQIIEICKKHNIKYYATWGTLLGAVRHRGFIPWDDDIDIALKRADYLKLIKLLEEELPSECCVYSIYRNKGHYQPTVCVTNYSTLPIPEEKIKEFHNCPYIVGIDIYVLDYIPRDEEMATAQLSLYNIVYDMAQRYEEIIKEGKTDYYVNKIEELCGTKLIRDDTLRNQLWILCDKISSMFTEEESDYLTFFQRRVKGDLNFKLDKSWFFNAKEVDFENIKISIPQGYHEILTKMYGDYSILLNCEGGHSYPFYKKQDEYLLKIAGR